MHDDTMNNTYLQTNPTYKELNRALLTVKIFIDYCFQLMCLY